MGGCGGGGGWGPSVAGMRILDLSWRGSAIAGVVVPRTEPLDEFAAADAGFEDFVDPEFYGDPSLGGQRGWEDELEFEAREQLASLRGEEGGESAFAAQARAQASLRRLATEAPVTPSLQGAEPCPGMLPGSNGSGGS